jgi:hypothetical protein
MISPAQWIDPGPRQHSSTVVLNFGPRRDPWLCFCSLQILHFWNGSHSSLSGGVWLLLVTPPLLGSDSAGLSFSPTLPLNHSHHSTICIKIMKPGMILLASTSSNLSDRLTDCFLFPQADLTENTLRRYEIYPIISPVCTVVTVKAMRKCCGRIFGCVSHPHYHYYFY